LSSEEQSRVKVAFAEGYLAADTQKKTSKTTKALKLFQNVLITVALIAILLSFFGNFILKLNEELDCLKCFFFLFVFFFN
jgi:hypothetical protein